MSTPSTIRSDMSEGMSIVLSPMIQTFSKYIIDNYDSLNNTTEDELVHEFYKLLDLPSKITQPTVGMGMNNFGPNLSSIGGIPSGFGPLPGIQGKASISRKSKSSKKDAPESLWLTVQDYMAQIASNAHICGYYCNRGDNKEKVCAAAVSDYSSSDHRKWRCVTCMDKKAGSGDISKKIKNPIEGINPGRAVPGVNIPPEFPLPQAPPSFSGFPNMNGMPNPMSFGMAKATPPSMSGLPPLPMHMGGLPSMKIPSPIKPLTPVPEPANQSLNLTSVSGLQNGHYMASNSNLKDVLFKVFTDEEGSNSALAIGKVATMSDEGVPSDYMVSLKDLSSDEQRNLVSYGISYKYEKFMPAMSMPPLSGLFK